MVINRYLKQAKTRQQLFLQKRRHSSKSHLWHLWKSEIRFNLLNHPHVKTTYKLGTLMASLICLIRSKIYNAVKINKFQLFGKKSTFDSQTNLNQTNVEHI